MVDSLLIRPLLFKTPVCRIRVGRAGQLDVINLSTGSDRVVVRVFKEVALVSDRQVHDNKWRVHRTTRRSEPS